MKKEIIFRIFRIVLVITLICTLSYLKENIKESYTKNNQEININLS